MGLNVTIKRAFTLPKYVMALSTAVDFLQRMNLKTVRTMSRDLVKTGGV